MATMRRDVGAAIGALRKDCERVIERIAEALRPKFEAGELHGWTEADHAAMEGDRRGYTPPQWKLENECTRRIRDTQTALEILMCSPFAVHGWDTYEANYPARQARPYDADRVFALEVRGKAGIAVARDVLKIARERRWYKPARGEEPSTAELRHEARRVA